MGTGGDFRHHAAERGMLVGLRQHDIRTGCARRPSASRSTIAAAVSSQVVSMPSTIIRCLLRLAIRCRTSALCRRQPGPLGGGPALALRGLMAQSASSAHLLRIGTRGSPLALAQAHTVRDRLVGGAWLRAGRYRNSCHQDHRRPILDRPLSEAGGKGLFTKEIEEALAREYDRHRGAFVQGHADGVAGRACAGRLSGTRGCARRLHQPRGPQRLPTCRRVRWSAPRRCAVRRW